MNRNLLRTIRWTSLAVVLHLAFYNAGATAAELQPLTVKAWNAYMEATERRIAQELKSSRGFLALDFQPPAQAALERRAVLAREIPVKQMESVDASGRKLEVPGGMIHHWRGAVFIPGADLEQILSRITNPALGDTRQEDVLQSKVLEKHPDFLRIYLKLQRSKFITVVFNTEHTVQACRYNRSRASSTSVATKIAEVSMPDSSAEKEKPEGQDRGFLWRMNSYWRYEQVAGGVIVECETITLSRDIPYPVELLIRPLIHSTARESMQRTLGGMRNRMARAQG